MGFMNRDRQILQLSTDELCSSLNEQVNVQNWTYSQGS